ncbi:hypothetical protein Tco_1491439 [Tanacetum coccineum]
MAEAILLLPTSQNRSSFTVDYNKTPTSSLNAENRQYLLSACYSGGGLSVNPSKIVKNIGKAWCKAMYDDFYWCQPLSAQELLRLAQAPQVLQTPTATTTTADSTPTPIIASSQATVLSNTSQDVDELEIQEHVQHQPATIADNVPNAYVTMQITFLNPIATHPQVIFESSSLQYADPSNKHTFTNHTS